MERKRIDERGRPDLVLALALIHHVVIGGNIPMAEFVQWLRDLGGELVIEFVTRKDPMVVTLLRNKEDQYADYDEDGLRARAGRAVPIAKRAAARLRNAHHVSRAPNEDERFVAAERRMSRPAVDLQPLHDLSGRRDLESRSTRSRRARARSTGFCTADGQRDEA